jgi:hypothetical protein
MNNFTYNGMETGTEQKRYSARRGLSQMTQELNKSHKNNIENFMENYVKFQDDSHVVSFKQTDISEVHIACMMEALRYITGGCHLHTLP